MDELELRRRLIAAPQENDEELTQAIQHYPQGAKLQSDLQALDAKITQALAVEVPEGLAEQLILRQRFHQHREKQKKFKWVFAMAASVLLAITASVALWPKPHSNLANYALAHVYHEPAALQSIDESADLHQLNVKLASYGVRATEELGHIYYANHCDFKGKRSLHLVLEHQGKKYTLFVVPGLNEFKQTPKDFSDKRYQGVISAYQNTALIIVGDSRLQLQSLNDKLNHSLEWERI